jgi:hypothetical protein
VSKELHIANERIRYGVKIFGVIIDDTIKIEDKLAVYTYVFSDSQLSYWFKKDDRDDFINEALSYVKSEELCENVSIDFNCPPDIHIVGRDDDLKMVLCQ